MNILFIAPLSPPVTGQSVASDFLFNDWKLKHKVQLINLSKQNFKQGLNSLTRVFEIFMILMKTIIGFFRADTIYFTVSESKFGMAKDILIYTICFFKLKKMVIHLHGGAGMSEIMSKKSNALTRINNFFVKRIGAIIILGDRHAHIYRDIALGNRIYTVPNFSSNELFLTSDEIRKKFETVKPIRLLFLSNLIPGKGHAELLQAYLSLDSNEQSSFILEFAGGFESPKAQDEFLKKIEGIHNVKYHGVVAGKQKIELFSSAHVFCLPTYYPYEGQPISILEAYASGCAVITTDHSGIGDIFSGGKNGYEVIPGSAESIANCLRQLINNQPELMEYALHNLTAANKNFRPEQYINRVTKIVESIS